MYISQKLYTMKTKIKELMTKEVVVANSSHKFSQVLEFFAQFPVHHIPVTEGDEVIGMISAKDVIHHLYNYMVRHDFSFKLDELNQEYPIEKLMTKDPVTIGSNDNLEKAAILFTTKHFQCLPVVDDGHVVGIITTKDVARQVLRHH